MNNSSIYQTGVRHTEALENVTQSISGPAQQVPANAFLLTSDKLRDEEGHAEIIKFGTGYSTLSLLLPKLVVNGSDKQMKVELHIGLKRVVELSLPVQYFGLYVEVYFAGVAYGAMLSEGTTQLDLAVV